MTGRKYYILALLLFLAGQSAFTQQVRIHGIVADGQTGEPLAEAIVFIKGANQIHAVSDETGTYTLTAKKGTHTLIASYLGYYRREITVRADRDTMVDFSLITSMELSEVEVSARAMDENVSGVQMGLEKLSAAEIKRMPALMGEVDVLKAIQLLPGVQTVAEGGSGFSVRGGSPDQNLIQIDNTTVYNASHLLGFFSVFNNDVLSGLSLYKGDIPLKYGGRLSSLLDVQTKTDPPKGLQGVGGIGLISSRLMLESPLGEKTSWMVGGRRSYADLFLKLSAEEALRKSVVYFYDLNAKLTHRLTEKDRFELNVYYGKDRFGATMGEFHYGNGAASLRWGHVFSEKLYLRTSLNLASYDYGLSSNLENAKASWVSSIRDWTMRVDLSHSPSDLWNLSYGVAGTLHRFNPGIITAENYDGVRTEGRKAVEYNLYISNEQKLSERVSVKYGVRGSLFQNVGKATVPRYDSNYEIMDSTVYGAGKVYHTYPALEPRAGLVVKLTDASSVKMNYAHNVQFIQLANNSASGSPLDIWFSAGPNIKPQHVDMYSAGYFHNLKENAWEASAEFYYKNLKNVIDFAEHANLLLNPNLDGEVRTGTGRAYGMEWMLRKNTGTLTGFLNYTLSRSERTIPDVNRGKTYLAPYDKTHAVNIVANYELSEKWNLSAVWVYATGNPTTYPSGRFEINGEYFPIYSGRNEYRRPDYHRLDLSVGFIPRPRSRKRWRSEWNLSLFNAYGKKNPWMITYDQNADTGRPYAEMLYLFGIVPSITYNFKF
ncbi:MAG: TonB-dependent receptor [Tannerella sp.]|nr:TonB-dependent receptor [Tannerella sp.]